MCFAYKSDQSIIQIKLFIYNSANGNNTNIYINYQGIADSQWHYNCTDLYSTFNSTQLPKTALIYQVKINYNLIANLK